MATKCTRSKTKKMEKKPRRPRRYHYTRVDMKTACESHRHTEKKASSLQRGKSARAPTLLKHHLLDQRANPDGRNAGCTAQLAAQLASSRWLRRSQGWQARFAADSLK